MGNWLRGDQVVLLMLRGEEGHEGHKIYMHRETACIILAGGVFILFYSAVFVWLFSLAAIRSRFLQVQ